MARCAMCGRKVNAVDRSDRVYSSHTKQYYCPPKRQKRCRAIYARRRKEES